MVSNLTSGNFSVVINNTGNMVVAFIATNDGGCLSYKIAVMDAVASCDELSFGSICVNMFPEIARANKIVSVPTVNAYRNGVLVKQITGIYSSDVLIKAFKIIYKD